MGRFLLNMHRIALGTLDQISTVPILPYLANSFPGKVENIPKSTLWYRLPLTPPFTLHTSRFCLYSLTEDNVSSGFCIVSNHILGAILT